VRSVRFRTVVFPKLLRVPVLVVAVANLVWGTIGGLAKLPITVIPPANWNISAVSYHGPSMVVGFLGTLVALERVVAIDRWWAYPIAWTMAGAGVLLLCGASTYVVGLVFCCGAALLAVLLGAYAVRGRSSELALMGAAAFGLAVGCLLWAWYSDVRGAVPWWTAFLVVTIAAERRELSKWNRRWKQVGIVFWPAVGAAGIGAVFTLVADEAGWRLTGAAWLLLALLLLWGDVILQFLAARGVQRFVALALAWGYGWLGLGGALWLLSPPVAGFGVPYDRALHSIYVGFVLSIVFAHAPLVAGSILGLTVVFTRLSYVPLLVLHASVALRIYGDLVDAPLAVTAGGIGHAVALLLQAASLLGAPLVSRLAPARLQ